MLEKKAQPVTEEAMAAYYDTGYGIYGGEQRQWAVLKFNSQATRYVEDEVWHPEQRSKTDKLGNYILEVPYVHSNELIMDVLRQGPQVEVLKPASLRKKLSERVTAMAVLYE